MATLAKELKRMRDQLKHCLDARYGADHAPSVPGELPGAAAEQLLALAHHRSHRAFRPDPVPDDLIALIAAVAFSAPSKSDLQQRDLVIIRDPGQTERVKSCLTEQSWTANAHTLLVICGNNRRQRQLHEMRGHPFANDHLDAFFNPAVDAGILLQAFITAAATVGLGCCPISAIRNHAQTVSDILGLPDHVFPVVGLAIGWPAHDGHIAMRLPLGVTTHVDRFDDSKVAADLDDYDRRRAAVQPIQKQRGTERFGTLAPAEETWSEDKTRQYAEPERADFGQFVVNKGFTLS